MSEKLNLVFFRMPQETPLVRELTNLYQSKENYNIEFIGHGAEVNQYLATEGSGILILEVKTKLDLQNAVSILKSQKKLVKSGLIKPACILHVKNKKVEKILTKYGCQDLLDDDITSKTLSFKIDFWSRSLTTLLKKKEKELSLKKSGAAKAQDKTSAKKSDFNLVDPLKLQSDIWLIKAKSDYKKILRRWLIRVLGPSPHVGNWVELEPQPGDRLPTWKFVTKNDDGQYILEDGAWFFAGSKPEFDWKINRWNFSSDAPHLYFYTQDGKVFSKFKYENAAVTIAENSQYALTKEQVILESCDSKFNIEGDEASDEEASNIEGEGETNNLGGNLEGKGGETEEDLGGNMSGKSSTDEIDGGPLSGKLDTKGNASEESSEAKRDGLYEEDDLGGNYGGKSSTDQLTNDPLSGKLKNAPGAEKEQADRDGMYEEDDLGGNYGGKSSTDNLGGNLGGKSSTDAISRDPLSGKLKNAPEAEKEQADRDGMYEEDDLGGNYGGKSSTDTITSDPLSGQLKSQGNSTTGRNRSEFSEDDLGGNYGGKSSTDQVTRDPLSGKLNTSNEDIAEANSSDGMSMDNPFKRASKDEVAPSTNQVDPSQLTDEDFKHPDLVDKLNSPEVNPLANDPDLAKQIEDELSRAGLSALDKDGNPVPLSEVAQMTEEEMSRAGIKVLDKDRVEVAPEAVAEAIDEELSRAGLKPLAKDIKAKKEEAINDFASTRTSMSNGYKDGASSAKASQNHTQSLEAKSGADLWDDAPRGKPADSAEKKGPSEQLSRDEINALNDKIQDSLVNPESSASKNPFGDRKKISADVRANEMEEALGGDLTKSVGTIIGAPKKDEQEGSVPKDKMIDEESSQDPQATLSKSTVIGEANEEEQKEKPDLSTIINGEPDFNTESGDLKVILKQTTKAGNDITFICAFEDFYEDELIVIAPKDSLANESKVKAKVTLAYGGKKVVVYCEGQIVEKEEYNAKKEMLVVSIANIDSSLYEDFMNLYQDRQKNIEDFMIKAKGLEGVDEAS